MASMRGGLVNRVRTERRPCAELTNGQPIALADGFDPGRAGWQLLFRGYGAAVAFNALPLTFLREGKLVAQVLAVRAEGEDWWGLAVPEPAPKTPEEADERFGAASGVGDVMRRLAEAKRQAVARSADVVLPPPPRENRHQRREREAQERCARNEAAARARR